MCTCSPAQGVDCHKDRPQKHTSLFTLWHTRCLCRSPCPSLCLTISICLYFDKSLRLSIEKNYLYVSLYPLAWLCNMHVCRFACLIVYPLIHQCSLCFSVYLSLLSVSLYVCLPVSVSVSVSVYVSLSLSLSVAYMMIAYYTCMSMTTWLFLSHWWTKISAYPLDFLSLSTCCLLTPVFGNIF